MIFMHMLRISEVLNINGFIIVTYNMQNSVSSWRYISCSKFEYVLVGHAWLR
jgi:hypothetical protein